MKRGIEHVQVLVKSAKNAASLVKEAIKRGLIA